MADSLRSYDAADAPAVLELCRRALARPGEQVGNPIWETRAELDAELSGWDRPPGETLLVVEEEGLLAGFGGLELAEGWGHADLFGPLVGRGFRGQKIGSRLLHATIDLARTLEVDRLVGAVGAHNVTGRMMLERAGFRPLEGAQALFRLGQTAHRPAEALRGGVAVRRGGPEDLPETLSLYRECFPSGEFPDQVWRTGLERGTVYLAEEAGRPVAVVDIDPSDRWIYHLGVTTSERAHGIGALLLSRALEDYWSTHPGETIGLTVSADNVPAIRLYRRQGFAPWLVLQSFQLEL